MPLVLMLALGVIEASYALLHQHVVTKLTREGSNLISRDTSLAGRRHGDAAHEHGRPVDFDQRTRR